MVTHPGSSICGVCSVCASMSTAEAAQSLRQSGTTMNELQPEERRRASRSVNRAGIWYSDCTCTMQSEFSYDKRV